MQTASVLLYRNIKRLTRDPYPIPVFVVQFVSVRRVDELVIPRCVAEDKDENDAPLDVVERPDFIRA